MADAAREVLVMVMVRRDLLEDEAAILKTAAQVHVARKGSAQGAGDLVVRAGEALRDRANPDEDQTDRLREVPILIGCCPTPWNLTPTKTAN